MGIKLGKDSEKEQLYSRRLFGIKNQNQTKTNPNKKTYHYHQKQNKTKNPKQTKKKIGQQLLQQLCRYDGKKCSFSWHILIETLLKRRGGGLILSLEKLESKNNLGSI